MTSETETAEADDTLAVIATLIEDIQRDTEKFAKAAEHIPTKADIKKVVVEIAKRPVYVTTNVQVPENEMEKVASKARQAAQLGAEAAFEAAYPRASIQEWITRGLFALAAFFAGMTFALMFLRNWA